MTGLVTLWPSGMAQAPEAIILLLEGHLAQAMSENNSFSDLGFSTLSLCPGSGLPGDLLQTCQGPRRPAGSLRKSWRYS